MASEEAERQFNKKAEPHAFLPDQLVLLDEHSFLAKNQKLAPKWSGPHKILRLKGECNVELLSQIWCRQGCKSRLHAVSKEER